jgi:hypothetical protein
MRSQYAVPKDYGIPNPYGPRLHNWKGGAYDEGSQYHGPIYTRPVYSLPRITQPLFGVEEAGGSGSGEPSLMNTALLGVAAFGLVYVACEVLLPRPRR